MMGILMAWLIPSSNNYLFFALCKYKWAAEGKKWVDVNKVEALE